MTASCLLAIPAFNERKGFAHIAPRIQAVHRACITSDQFDVLLVDDGSTDDTASVAIDHKWTVLRHSDNRGYGASLISASQYAIHHGYDYLVTMDADGQHPPELVPEFLNARLLADVVSGSRYLAGSQRVNEPPAPHVNQYLCRVVNATSGLNITDVGCGMKCIRVRTIAEWRLTEMDYLFPLEFWVRCGRHSAHVYEVPVPMIYLDRSRNHESKFGTVETLIEQAMLALFRALTTPPPLSGAAITRAGQLGSAFTDRQATIASLIGTLILAEPYGLPVGAARSALMRLAASSDAER